MINLNIKGYCEECPYFEPESIDHIIGTDGITLKVDHEIVCKNKDACSFAISNSVFAFSKDK